MPALLQHLHQQLAQYQPNRTHFLVALSGGIDSVVLLHLTAMQAVKYSVYFAKSLSAKFKRH